MYKAAAKLKKFHHVTRLTKGFKSDLRWWHYFATNWNGVSFIDKAHARDQLHCIQTDASGHWGCRACLNLLWFQHAWSPEWSGISIMTKELVPIIFSCAVWGSLLTKTHVEFQCDNLGLVEAINKGSSKDVMVMHLLRCLWFFPAIFDISIHVSYIPGVQNCAAVMLSRNQLTKFLHCYPDSSPLPEPIPSSLIQMISPRQHDWTSPEFLRCFRQSIKTIKARDYTYRP